MKKLIMLFVLSFSVLSFADECPIAIGSEDFEINVDDKIEKSGSCEAANQIAEACLGTTTANDVEFLNSAEAVCTKGITKKTELDLLKKLIQRCESKYAKAEGTMWIVVNAGCRLSAARFMNDVNTPVEE